MAVFREKQIFANIVVGISPCGGWSISWWRPHHWASMALHW
ncbi:hypothetical protein HMPREF3193_01287 [Bifidobacterium breve]|nr:hypothetical protein HMPREF3193_01287 [Bifidobacterium breve]